MAKLEGITDTRTKVSQLIEDGEVVQSFRPYLGMSGIASPCARQLWYGFRCCAERKETPRKIRLLNRGHREEPVIVEDLKRIGIIFHSDQLEVTDGNGHIKGHIDGLLDNVPDAPKTRHLSEFKTHNDKSFKDLLKKGLIKSKPVHYGQMICYMRKLKLERGLYVAVNKNDDAREYLRIESNNEKADFYLKRGLDIISSEIPPKKMSENPSWFECKWCVYQMICHYGDKPLKHCRTCKHADIHDEGIWACSGYKIQLSFSQQLLGCERHKFMECFL